MSSAYKNKSLLTVLELVIFAMLGTLMWLSKLLMEFLPNIHLMAMLTMVYTVVYRWKALFPIGVCVVLIGLQGGFSPWWVPHLYMWAVLWGVTMLLPRHMPLKIAAPVYTVVCVLHGLLYGTLWAPTQWLFYGGNIWAWIVSGLPFDLMHGVGNFFASLLILPMIHVLNLARRAIRQ